MKPISLVAVLVFLVACFLGSVRAQTHDKKDEIPIERCDRLPVVTMKVAGENRRFLLDSAATTILNLKSFTSGESKQIHIYSWSGSAATSAREVFLPQVDLGTHKLRNLKLHPASYRTAPLHAANALFVESDCTSSGGKLAQATTSIGEMACLVKSLQDRIDLQSALVFGR